jgi:cytochrome c oxidase subunit 2
MMEKILGLPVLTSVHGAQVDKLIIYVHWLMAVLFVGWFGYFIYALFRFRKSRNPKADYVGVKNHASTWVEVMVAIVEGLLLFAMAIPYWAMAVDKFPAEKDATVIRVVAQQFAWNVRYAGKDGVFGTNRMDLVTALNPLGLDQSDPHTKDDIQLLNEIHVPVNKEVLVYLSSKDVIHSFKLIAARVTQDAIPGMVIPFHFLPTKEGKYQINCAQLCGNGHSTMAAGMVFVESETNYQKWIGSKSGGGANYE